MFVVGTLYCRVTFVVISDGATVPNEFTIAGCNCEDDNSEVCIMIRYSLAKNSSAAL